MENTGESRAEAWVCQEMRVYRQAYPEEEQEQWWADRERTEGGGVTSKADPELLLCLIGFLRRYLKDLL